MRQASLCSCSGEPVKAPGRVVSSPSPVSQGAIIPCLAAPALFHLDLCFCGHVSCDSPVSLSWDLGITLGPPRQPRTSTPISRSLKCISSATGPFALQGSGFCECLRGHILSHIFPALLLPCSNCANIQSSTLICL